MHNEIQIALEFLVSFLHNKIPKSKICTFSRHLTSGLLTRFDGHWYPERPTKGSAFRCLTLGKSKIDDVIKQACLESGLDADHLQSTLTSDVSVWVDPDEVSYRIGENGAVKILINFAANGPPPPMADNQQGGYQCMDSPFGDGVQAYVTSTPSPLHHGGGDYHMGGGTYYPSGPVVETSHYYDQGGYECGEQQPYDYEDQRLNDYYVTSSTDEEEKQRSGGLSMNGDLHHQFYSSPGANHHHTYINNNSSDGNFGGYNRQQQQPPNTSPLYFNKLNNHHSSHHHRGHNQHHLQQQSPQQQQLGNVGQSPYLALTPPPSFHHNQHSHNGHGHNYNTSNYHYPHHNNHSSGKFMGSSKYHYNGNPNHSQASGYYHHNTGKRTASAMNTPFHYSSNYPKRGGGGSINNAPGSKGSSTSPPFYQSFAPNNNGFYQQPPAPSSTVARNGHNLSPSTTTSQIRRGLTFSPSPIGSAHQFTNMTSSISSPEDVLTNANGFSQQPLPIFYNNSYANRPGSQTVYFNTTKADFTKIAPSDTKHLEQDLALGKNLMGISNFQVSSIDAGFTKIQGKFNSNNVGSITNNYNTQTNTEAQSQTLSSSYNSSTADEQNNLSGGTNPSYDIRSNGINSLDIITNNLQHLLVAN